jgi:putative serine protease PepD
MLVCMTDDPTEPKPASAAAPSSAEPTDPPPPPPTTGPPDEPPYPAPPAPAVASGLASSATPFPGPAAPPAPPAPQHVGTTETPPAGGSHTDTAEQPAVSGNEQPNPANQADQTDQFAAAGRGAPPLPPAAPPAGPAPTGSSTPPSPPRRGRRAVAVLAAAGLMAASGAGGALLALSLDDDETSPASNSLNAATVSGDSDTAPDEPLSQAAATVLPSVVSITFDSDQGGTGQGSGVVISSDGQILTNNHVAAEGEDGGLSVTFSDGSRADAEILGRDPATDLAVIQAQDVSGLTEATLGSSADLHVGDTVLAIGSPLGLDGSVSAGIVSALNRSITLQETPLDSPFGDQGDEPSGATDAVIDAIQTDAAINPGNSGGALIDTDGEVIGINTAIASLAGGAGAGSQSGNIGVGFAIPIDDARVIADQLIDDGEATHAYLGVRIGNAEEGTGAVVGGVEEGQPAADAGLEEGDVITKVDDRDITDATALTSAIRSHQPGDQVTITYTRDGEEQTTEVTLGELPAD